MDVNYDERIFRSVANSAGGDVGGETLFHYRQTGGVVWATYAGGSVAFGTLIAKLLPGGELDMRYQHLTCDGLLKAGRCRSTPTILADGRLRLSEVWEWTEGGEGKGVSVIEEVREAQ
jgi:hypothetical protein